MLNRALHLLTNRSRFNSVYFVPDAAFVPCKETADSAEVRRLLGLDQETSDYHTRAVLGAVHGVPVIFDEFHDPVRTYRATDFDREPVVMLGAVWIFDETGAPEFSPVTTDVPAVGKLTLTAIDASRALLVYGSRSETLATRYAADAKQLYPQWPEDLGIVGGLQLVQTWTTGSKINITGYPARYPWKQVAESLRQSASARTLLQTANLVGHFHNADSSVEQVAVVALALAKTHPLFNV